MDSSSGGKRSSCHRAGASRRCETPLSVPASPAFGPGDRGSVPHPLCGPACRTRTLLLEGRLSPHHEVLIGQRSCGVGPGVGPLRGGLLRGSQRGDEWAFPAGLKTAGRAPLPCQSLCTRTRWLPRSSGPPGGGREGCLQLSPTVTRPRTTGESRQEGENPQKSHCRRPTSRRPHGTAASPQVRVPCSPPSVTWGRC